MRTKMLIKSGLILTSLLLATLSYAEVANNNIVQCPYPSAIKSAASKIDAGAPDQYNQYNVYTSTPAFYRDNLPWHVIALTTFHNLDQALKRGKEIVQQVNYPENDNAEAISEGTYVCYYLRNMLSEIVIAVGGKFDPASIFSHLPFKH